MSYKVMSQKYGNIIVVGVNTPIECECEACGYQFDGDVTKDRYCPSCLVDLNDCEGEDYE